MSTFVDSKIAGKKIMIFSKSTCPSCMKAKAVFQKYIKDGTIKVDDYEATEIDERSDCAAIQDYLRGKTGARTVPRVFVNEKFIGGGDDVVSLDRSGKLAPLLKA
ncbi:uncharacterized protein LOC143296934 [Babylonia areolata]|uniref:uncharacterized protein LOC143296934 n=1 Tax=Babylonia areolata TaxID=304850 RepID=UPI003FD4D20A